MRNDPQSEDIPAFRDPKFLNTLGVLYAKDIDTTGICLISLAAATLGMKCRILRKANAAAPTSKSSLPKILEVTAGDQTDLFVGCVATSSADMTSARILRSKLQTRKALAAAGIKVAAGGAAHAGDMTILDKLEQAGVARVTVKPDVSSMGRGLLPNVDIATARAHISAHPDIVFVAEQHISGVERRFFVAGGNLAVDMIKSRDHVLGNGRDTLHDLVESKSQRQSQNPNCMAGMTPAPQKIAYLRTQRLDLEHVPERGKLIPVDDKPLAKFYFGGFQPRETRPETRQLAADVARAVNTTTGAVDAIDTGGNGVFILEFNVKPSIVAASFPMNAPWNQTLPNALLRSSFPDHKEQQRNIDNYNFARLIKDYVDQPDRNTFDVSDYMTFA